MKLLRSRWWITRSPRVAAISMPILAVLAGCAIREATPDDITIVYNAMHPQVAEFKAQRHCNQFGKMAVLAETTPVPPSFETLFTRSRRSLFRCVPSAGANEAP